MKKIFSLYLGLMMMATPALAQKTIEVAGEDRMCETDEECIWVATDCASQGCECFSVGVNKAHKAKYETMIQQCRGDGPIAKCDNACPRSYDKCIAKQCYVVSDGPMTLYYDNGNKWWELSFKDGKQHGSSLVYHRDSGKMIIEQEFENGVLNGKSNMYNPGGILMREGTVKHGKVHGISRRYNQFGKVSHEWTFHEGLIHGPSKEYYPDGVLKGDLNYANDKREGPAKIYHRNGQVAWDLVYENDKVISKKKFDPEGNLIE